MYELVELELVDLAGVQTSEASAQVIEEKTQFLLVIEDDSEQGSDTFTATIHN